ncbi:hypothetical protein CHARACLAT_008968 [Characodon lateralis]|uniref:Uncharacterized protein n=1 Tax=Characodon lateralis TaxID=208331 RepID=A0ABU7D5Y1_9TELE|nr:hypothetical protein [Characodon lateralis]
MWRSSGSTPSPSRMAELLTLSLRECHPMEEAHFSRLYLVFIWTRTIGWEKSRSVSPGRISLCERGGQKNSGFLLLKSSFTDYPR